MKSRVLIVDSMHPILREILEQHGFVCEWACEPEHEKEFYYRFLPGLFGLVIRSRFRIDRDFIDRAPDLKFIARLGAGMENIDTDYATAKGILCFNSPEGNRDALGEHCLGMLLSLVNHMKRADTEVRQGIWKREKNRGMEIKGKTVAIIGYGNMGSAFAQRLKGFECRIIAYDKYKQGFQNEYVDEVTMDEVFSETDILSLHIPLTEETTYMVNSLYLQGFTKPIILINTARGLVVKTDDLVEEMKTGKVTGAALDVIEYEDVSFEDIFNAENGKRKAESVMLNSEFRMPDGFKYLISRENVILTPHIAGFSAESKVRLARVLAEKIVEAFK